MRNLLKRISVRAALVVGLTLAVTLAGGVVVASQASAALPARKTIPAGWENCPHGYTCLWENANYQGRGVAFLGNEANFATLPTAYRFINNTASSVFNRGTRQPGYDTAYLYQDANYNPTNVWGEWLWRDYGDNGIPDLRYYKFSIPSLGEHSPNCTTKPGNEPYTDYTCNLNDKFTSLAWGQPG